MQIALGLGAQVAATTLAKDVDYVTGLGVQRVWTTGQPDGAPLRLGSYDVVVDTVGGPAMRDSMALVRPGGTYITLQQPAPADRLADLGVAPRAGVEPSRPGGPVPARRRVASALWLGEPARTSPRPTPRTT